MKSNTKNTSLVLFRIKYLIGTNGGISYIPNIVTGYPVPHDALVARIKKLLQIKNKDINDFQEFNLYPPELLKEARKSLVGFGGVYLLWNKATGQYYVGSTIRFITQINKHGRLSTYFTYKEINKSDSKFSVKQVNIKLRLELNKYTIYSFHLFILESFSQLDLCKIIIQEKEQFWMLINPTMNTTIITKTGIANQITTEDVRRQNPTLITFYVYIIINSVIVHKQTIFGLRYLSENGIKETMNNGTSIIHKIEYHLIRYHLDTGYLFKEKYLISIKDLSLGLAVSNVNIPKHPKNGVWVYDHETITFIEYFKYSDISICREKYSISSTHFKRVCRNGKPFNGVVFSNVKLS